MSLRQYLIALAIGTAISISAWCIIVMSINPATAGWLAFSVFYLTLGAGIAGLFTIGGTVIRSRKYAEDQIHSAVARSFRQAMMLSGLFLSCLFLLSRDLFSLGTMLLLVVLVGLVELLMMSIRKEA